MWGPPASPFHLFKMFLIVTKRCLRTLWHAFGMRCTKSEDSKVCFFANLVCFRLQQAIAIRCIVTFLFCSFHLSVASILDAQP